MNLKPLPYYPDTTPYFHALASLPGAVWLDSGKPGSDDGRYDILSAVPSDTLKALPPQALEHAVTERLEQRRVSSELPFSGGWIGFVGYEYRHPHFKLATPEDPLCPNHWFGWYDWALIQDHATQTTLLVSLDDAKMPADLSDRLARAHQFADAAYTCGPFRNDVSRSRYLEDVSIISDAISAGECYQVNYAQRFSAPFQGSTAQAYLSLRRATPNPYCAYLALPSGETLLSLSQERFLQISGNRATTEPIKGTINRGNNADSDLLNQQILQASEKNRAENLMIVDLLRNDFSQNCKPHSIQVPELFALKSYSNVHHLVSTVTGTLKEGVSHCQFLLDCFPGGSITGAPKKRAMEIIQSLEPFSRGPYCGAIGYWSANGETDFNISIRTLLHAGQQLYCWGGGGIVADSVGEEEYQESLQKIAVLMSAIAPA